MRRLLEWLRSLKRGKKRDIENLMLYNDIVDAYNLTIENEKD